GRAGGAAVDAETPITDVRVWSRDRAVAGDATLPGAAGGRRPPRGPTCPGPLGGGRDARHILLELCEQGLRPDFCLTARLFPAPAAYDEVEVAASLCQALGLRCLTLDQRESLMQAESDKNLRTGFCSFEHNWDLVLADH